METIVRIKRSLDEEPLEGFIINYKRRKGDDNQQTECSTLLKFAGTTDQNHDIFKNLRKPTKHELEEEFKKHNVDILQKIKQQKLEERKKNQYKIISCYRSEMNNKSEANPDTSEITVYDIESENKKSEVDAEFTYDLYYTTSDDLGLANLDEDVSIYPLSDNLMYGSARDNGLNESDSEDSEDSNAENFWKNDYPDESDLESINEDDMIRAMDNVSLGNSLSSDEEGLVYSAGSANARFVEGVDELDVQRHGERYAIFKALNRRNVEDEQINSDSYHDDTDPEDYYH